MNKEILVGRLERIFQPLQSIYRIDFELLAETMLDAIQSQLEGQRTDVPGQMTIDEIIAEKAGG